VVLYGLQTVQVPYRASDTFAMKNCDVLGFHSFFDLDRRKYTDDCQTLSFRSHSARPTNMRDLSGENLQTIARRSFRQGK